MTQFGVFSLISKFLWARNINIRILCWHLVIPDRIYGCWNQWAAKGYIAILHFVPFDIGSNFVLVSNIAIELFKKSGTLHDDVIKWKHFPRYWTFVRGIHRFPVNSPHKGQWRGGLMFSLICVWINGWVNNREAGDLRRHSAHYDVIVMMIDGTQMVGTKQ